MKLVSIVGARPQFVKLAPIVEKLKNQHQHLILHTGQHYDDSMSDSFFRDLDIPLPDRNLEIGSGPHGQQTGLMIAGIEQFLIESQPDWVVLYGDTNSTLAGAVAASKLGFRIAHIEAGLRSRNRQMPEETNRVLTDHASDLCLAPTPVAMENLKLEGLGARSVNVGDIMVDGLIRTRTLVAKNPPQLEWDVGSDFVFATFHRQELMDDSERLLRLVSELGAFPLPVVLAAHPRLRNRLDKAGMTGNQVGNLLIRPPLSYLQLITVLGSAKAVVTDSGGLQKEAYLMRVPCATVRPETEWVETVESGWNRLVWNDLSVLNDMGWLEPQGLHDPGIFGDGHSSEKIIAAIEVATQEPFFRAAVDS